MLNRVKDDLVNPAEEYWKYVVHLFFILYLLLGRGGARGGDTCSGNCYRCAALNASALHSKSQKAPFIGAKFAENPPILGKDWVILKENGHYLHPKWR